MLRHRASPFTFGVSRKRRPLTCDHQADRARSYPPAGQSKGRAGHPLRLTAAQAKAAQVRLYDHALAVGFSRGFVVSAGIMVLALLVAIVMIRVTREDLAGVEPMPG